MRKLVDMGLIRRVHRNRRSNMYHLNVRPLTNRAQVNRAKWAKEDVERTTGPIPHCSGHQWGRGDESSPGE